MYKVSLHITFKNLLKYRLLNTTSMRHFARNIRNNNSSINVDNTIMNDSTTSSLNSLNEKTKNVGNANDGNNFNVINSNNRPPRGKNRDSETFNLNEQVKTNFYKKKHSKPESEENVTGEAKNEENPYNREQRYLIIIIF
jgi:hypothetical protein